MRAGKPAGKRAGRRAGRPGAGWTEADSRAFGALGEITVPARQEQIEVLVRLIPAEPGEVFTVVELSAGTGTLAQAILSKFPRCHYVALDRSERMRAALRKTLHPFGSRALVGEFELADGAWRRDLPEPLRCVLASLAVHHLSDAGKRRLFTDMAARLDRGGALLVADLVQPATVRIQRLFAGQWTDAARAQSRTCPGGAAAFARFTRDGWNYYAASDPDPYDQPARLLDQLVWLKTAGFERVDCFWMRAGHAIFGGYVK